MNTVTISDIKLIGCKDCKGKCFVDCINQENNKCKIYTGNCETCKCLIGCNW